jgi:hypothetical protein
MDPKLTILFCLIGTIIGLSHFSGEESTKLKRQPDRTSRYLRMDNRAAAESPQVASRPIDASIKAESGLSDRG